MKKTGSESTHSREALQRVETKELRKAVAARFHQPTGGAAPIEGDDDPGF